MFGGGYVPVDLPPGMSDLPPAPKVTCESLQAATRLKYAQEEDDSHPVAPQPTAPFGLASHREVLEHLRDAIFLLDRVDADGKQIFCVAVGDAYTVEGELRVTLSRVYLDDHEQWTLWGGDDYVKEEYTVSKMTGAYSVSRCPPHVIDVASVAARYHEGDGAEWTGPWTADEHQEFLKCLDLFGEPIFELEWNKFAERIRTRSLAQIRSYAREHFQQIEGAEGAAAASPEFAQIPAASPEFAPAPEPMTDDDEPDAAAAPLPKPPPPKPAVPQKESACLVGQLVRTDREKMDLETVRDDLGRVSSQADLGRVGGKLAGRIGENKYVVGYATDCRAKCKLFSCKRSLFLGELRIGKVPPKVNPVQRRRVHWYHPSCVFQSFRGASKKTKLIDHPEKDLEGWHALQPNDRAFIDLCLRRSREAPGAAARAAVRREITALCHEMTEAVDLLVSPQLARQEIRALCRSMTEEVEHLVEPAAANDDEPEEAPDDEEAGDHKCECGRCFDTEQGLENHKSRWCTGGKRPIVMTKAEMRRAAQALATMSEQAQSVSALAPSVARGSRSRPRVAAPGAPAPRFVALPPPQRKPSALRRQPYKPSVYVPPPADASPAVTFNEKGKPRWASGNHAQDTNDATVRGIVIDINLPNKHVATTTGTVVSLVHLTPTTLTDEEVARVVIPASQKDYVQARIDGKICVDIVGRTFLNRYTAADGTERRQFEVTATHIRCALCPDARTWSTANFTGADAASIASHCGVYDGGRGRAHRERLAVATGLAAELASAPTDSPPSSSGTAPGDWRVGGAQVANADDPSVRGIIVRRLEGHLYYEVRTTKDTVVNIKHAQLTQTTLTDEEAASCSRTLSSTEYLRARVDGAICVRYAGREFKNCYTSADGTERRQIEVTATGDVRCALCCGDAPFSWSSQTPWKTLANDLRIHAGHIRSQQQVTTTQTHLKSLFASAGVPMPEESFFAPARVAPVGAPRRVGTRSQPEPSGESPKRQRSDAAPPPDELADDEEPAVGRRVWALFEPDVWWGGTIISMSGAEDKRACSIIFDDGIPQTFYARDVWSSPPAGGKVGAQGPNAQARTAVTRALSAKATTPLRPKPRKRPKRGFYAAYAESSEPAPTPAPRRKKKPVAPSDNCPICYETLSADATVFECSHAMCASCAGSYAKSEVQRSMSRRSGVSVACPLCRAPSKVALPTEMHTAVP